ncbi:hypothetical protein CGJ93_12820 [Vibrio parahaemolyticus]|nr:hypothetical protein D5E70_24015 [Vibrio parahaemolyticus]TNZ90007.1 hypothetical protein CGK37_18310 [Vibrio parahaemolyticus]TOA11575.1 hypothetical protein CGK34_18145 [Vibrio parahaemolyticus]TOB04868.1 hypothetical protein CGK14_09730 [Vibrio parahaemolyticus]TOB72966.1 hypothetical protein CGJ98_22175 [Vibrio parahaemolyticus]
MVGSPRITKHLRGIHNAWQFWFELALVFSAQWFRLGGGVVHPLMRRYVLGGHGGVSKGQGNFWRFSETCCKAV